MLRTKAMAEKQRRVDKRDIGDMGFLLREIAKAGKPLASRRSNQDSARWSRQPLRAMQV
jgi:hypothetical protein